MIGSRCGACTAAVGVVLALAAPSAADRPPAERLGEARGELEAARAELDRLLVRYRDAALAADEAGARVVISALRVEQARASATEARGEFEDKVRSAYMNAGAQAVGLVLGSEDLASLAARLPYASAALERDAIDLRALLARREAAAETARAMDEDQAALIAAEGELHVLRDRIEARMRAAEANVRAGERALAELRSAWETARLRVGSMIGTARHRRGEAMLAAASGYLGPREDCSIPSGLRPTGDVLEGAASWYGPGFYGRPTASGAIYTIDRYTVAHRTLPFGLILLIRLGDRCVLALVNDRGPYVQGRILDLGAATARAIGLSGVQDVTATILVRA